MIAAGLLLDRLLGEPPTAWHPVARYGSLMERIERRTYADTRAAGIGHVAIGIAVGALAGAALRRAVGRGPATAIATFVCSAGAMLDAEGLAVAALARDADLGPARARVRSLVGRRADELDAGELSRAVIESIAENGVDAVTATVFWAAVGGAPAALAHRAVNTLDAMVGHRSARYARFGWASARLDDVLNAVPARLTALAVALVRPRRSREVVRVVRRDAGRHPSPNGGVIEAAFAAALDLQLGGVNRYGDVVEDRGRLGDGRAPTPEDVTAAVRLRRDATVAMVGLVGLVSPAVSVARRGGRWGTGRRARRPGSR